MRRSVTLLVGLLIAGLMLTCMTSPARAAADTVTNGGLEQVTGGVPDCFEESGYGQNSPTWATATAAHSGTVAMSVSIANYAGGDRKLLMTENSACAPSVTAGTAYHLAVWYKSTVATSLTVFRHSVAGWTYYTDLKALPAAAGWSLASADTAALPSGTDQLTFGISLSANGTLVTDDYSLAPTNNTPAPTELTSNGGLETTAGSTPAGWMTAGWGDGTVSGAITRTAHTGSSAYALTLTGRTVGDYKLLPTASASPAVQPGQIYRLTAWYTSTSAANSLTVFAHTASGWGYWTDLQSLPPASAWTQVTTLTPSVPAGVDAIAWGISIAANGVLSTDDYSTMLSADATAPPTGTAATGQWQVLDYQMPIRAMHATVLRNGKVLLVAGSGNSVDNFNAGSFKAAVWDPVSGTFLTLAVPKDMFCNGHVTLPDGRVLIQGGTKSYPTSAGGADYGGLRSSWIFNPDTNTFTTVADANEGHWYPTLTELGNGDIWMAGGLKEDTTGAVNTERWDSKAGTWLATNQVNQTYSYWGLYPHMFLLSDGRLFYSGAHVFGNGLPGTGASLYNPNTGVITDVPGLRSKDLRDQAASVLLPPAQDQKVLIAGGGNINTTTPGINLTDLIDLNATSPAYVSGPDLPGGGKMYLNATILPDRTVLISNGGKLNRDNNTNVMTAAVYDPAINAWTSVAADPIGRNYHSTAVLLPDGRVAVFGSNPGDGTFEMRISIYSPSYLFRSARPQLTGAPTSVTYGQGFTTGVTTAPGTTVRWAQLSRPMSVTHQMDSNMRLVDLPVTVTNGTATMSITANPNLLPPGPYMLTVTDSAGVPSTASWVMVK